MGSPWDVIKGGAQKLGDVVEDVALFPVKASTKIWQHTGWLFGVEPGFLPKEEDIKIQAEAALEAKSPEQAREIINSYIGHESGDAAIVRMMQRQGLLERTLFSTEPEDAYLSIDPFSNTGRTLFASGALGDQYGGIDPWMLSDTTLQGLMEENPRMMWLYMREKDPLAMMPVVAETDMEKVGQGQSGKWYDSIFDLGGRILGGGKDIGMRIIMVPERFEEMAGWYYYNDIPDAHMRLQMAHQMYEYNLNFWDWDKTHEAGARNAMDEITARGLRGEEAAEELAKYMATDNMGLAGSVTDLVGKILYDPLWLVPVGKVAQLGVGMPLRAATGAPKISRLLRFFAPATRRAMKDAPRGTYTWKKIYEMDALTHADFRAASAGKGALAFLAERDPGAFGRLVARQMQYKIYPHMDDIARDLGVGGKMMDDLLRTFQTGKLQGWVKQGIPDLFDEPTEAIANFSRRACSQGEFTMGVNQKLSDIAESPFWSAFNRYDEIASEIGEHVTAPGVLSAGTRTTIRKLADDVVRLAAQGERPSPTLQRLGQNLHEAARTGNKVAIRQHSDELLSTVRLARSTTIETHFLDQANNAMVTAQKAVFRNSAAGRILVDKWMPIVGGMRQAIAGITLNNPGFVFLNIMSNMARHMWTFARHPGLAGRTYSQSLFAEMTAVFPRGGKYPALFLRRLGGHPGLTPRRVEHFISSQTGIHELLAQRVARGELGPSEMMELLAKESQQPIKHLFEAPRKVFGLNQDKLMFPVYLAGRMDSAARRGAFFASLNEQAGLMAVPSWVGRGPGRALADDLARMGVEGSTARRIESQQLDDLRAIMTGELEVPAGKTAEGFFLERALVRADQIEQGVATAGGFSVTDVAWRWAKLGEPQGLGLLSDDAARAALRDIWPLADQLHVEVLEPYLAEVIAGKRTLRSLNHMIDARVMPYYGEADIMAQLSNMHNMIRNPTTYLDGLRLSNRAIVAEMADDALHLHRHMQRVLVGWEGNPKNWKRIKEFNRLQGEVTAEQGRRLTDINERFYQKAAREGLESVEYTDDLARAWDEYFEIKDKAYKELHNFVRTETGKVLGDDQVRVVDEWYDGLRKTHQQHRANIQEAAKEGTFEAWGKAGEKNKILYETNAKRRAGIFGHGVNDPPAAQQIMDASGPLAKEVDTYAQYLKAELRAALPELKTGKRALAAPLRGSAAEEIRANAKQVMNNWKAASQEVVGTAMAKTDFIMLNYNNQYGFDRLFQAFMPFFFWPTRDTIHWAVRAARQPGAFVGVWQAMLWPKAYSEQYGLPERLQFNIPVYMPGLGEALSKTPIVGEMLSDASFSPLYFIDPIRLMFPFTSWRDQYDSPMRRDTPAGRTLDFMENWFPMMSVNPFAKIIGAETGLLDKDAWSSVQFSGGPYGIPLSATGQAAGRWLYGGDLDAIPEEEMYSYTEKGYFSIPFLGRALNLEPDRFDIYRAERATWALAATDDLLPGEPHDVQAKAAMLAVRDHKGKAWATAVRAAEGEDFLRMATSYIGFPFGGFKGMQEGERIWYGLRGAYSEYAEEGKIDEFFEKYPEFQVRTAVVRGLSDPDAKRRAIDTSLFYDDVEKIVEAPYATQIARIQSELTTLAHLTQTDSVREQVSFLKKELGAIRVEQKGLRTLVENMYPYRDTTISLRHPPRDYALRAVDDEWYALSTTWYESDGDALADFESLEEAQEAWLSQFPAYGTGGSYTEKDWQDAFNDYANLTLKYGKAMQSAARDEEWELRDSLKEEMNAKLEAAHERWAQGLSRRDVESYLASRKRPKTPEEVEFLYARDLREMWMSLVARGSPFTSREKGDISDFFRSMPVIQKHYPFKAAPLENFTIEQRFAMFRRDEIWDRYYAFSDPGVAVDFMKVVGEELNTINEFLGLPPMRLIDYRQPPPELGAGDPFLALMQMRLAILREAGLEEDAKEGEEPMDAETLQYYSELLAADPDDPSPLSTSDVDWLIAQWADPD